MRGDISPFEQVVGFEPTFSAPFTLSNLEGCCGYTCILFLVVDSNHWPSPCKRVALNHWANKEFKFWALHGIRTPTPHYKWGVLPIKLSKAFLADVWGFEPHPHRETTEHLNHLTLHPYLVTEVGLEPTGSFDKGLWAPQATNYLLLRNLFVQDVGFEPTISWLEVRYNWPSYANPAICFYYPVETANYLSKT